MTKKKKIILRTTIALVIICVGISLFFLFRKPSLELLLKSKNSTWELTVTDVEFSDKMKKEIASEKSSKEFDKEMKDFKKQLSGVQAIVDFYTDDKASIILTSPGFTQSQIPIICTFKDNEAKFELNYFNDGTKSLLTFTSKEVSKNQIEGTLTFPPSIASEINIKSATIKLKNKHSNSKPIKDTDLENLLTIGNGEWQFTGNRVLYLYHDDKGTTDGKEVKEPFSELDGAFLQFEPDGKGNTHRYNENSNDNTDTFTYKITNNIIQINFTNSDYSKPFELIVESSTENKINANMRWSFDDESSMSSDIPEGKIEIILNK